MGTLTDTELYNYIKTYFMYDEEIGHLVRVKKTNKNQKLGICVGNNRADGYVNVSINGKLYLEHRLIWLYHYKSMPIEIDHIDRDNTNNRLTNLRASTRSLNMHNVVVYNNRQLPTGVHKHYNKFRALLGVNGVQKHLGLYSTVEDAEKAYLKAKHEYFDE